MSLKSSLIKTAIKWTPNKLIVWVANIVLKDIAELLAFSFELETRKVYVEVQLLGEAESIQLWLEDFAIIDAEGTYQFMINAAKSNRLWLDNLLSRFVGKTWKIPVPEQFAAQFAVVAEVFAATAHEEAVEDNPQ